MKILEQKFLLECFSYNEKTGDLFWIERPRSHFTTDRGWKRFNTMYPGKVIRCIDTNETGNKYYVVGLKGSTMRIHRLIWCMVHGEMPKYYIDHINGDSLDNRLSNLRDVTNTENQRNQRLSERNTSGYMNVNWNKAMKKWIVGIRVEGKKKYISSHDCIIEANESAIRAREKYGYHKNHGKKPQELT